MHSNLFWHILIIMDAMTKFLLNHIDHEFRGPSMNGPSLMETLRPLSHSKAASHKTFDGYSAWEIAVHLANYRMIILRELGKAAPLEPYRWRSSDFAPQMHERDATAASWTACLEYLEQLHDAVLAAFRSSDAPKPGQLMDKWGIPWGEVLVWYSGHDTFHSAQLRSMGTPGIDPVPPSY